MPTVLAEVANRANVKVAASATQAMSAETVAETDRLWTALGFAHDEYPMKQKLAIMAHAYGVESNWGWPWPDAETPPPQLPRPYPAVSETKNNTAKLENMGGWNWVVSRGMRVCCVCILLTSGLLFKSVAACMLTAVFALMMMSRTKCLQTMLGEGCHVENFGVCGVTLLENGHNPFVQRPELSRALAYNPDIVVINLGTNDANRWNWDLHKTEFVADYLKLIDTLQSKT